MKRSLTVAFGLCISGSASAGGLLLPGAGVVSTSRAGAAVASADDSEAITLNPAGIAQSEGTVITIGAVATSYSLSFARAGSYPTGSGDAYAGQPYPKMSNDSKPSLGFGSYQPIPLVGVVTDLHFLGDATWMKRLHVGLSIYSPNAYPFRNFNNVNGQPYYTKDGNGNYGFPSNLNGAPPPTRYDVVAQDAAIVLPSIAAAYSILPNLSVGGRFSAGYADFNSAVAVWGLTNYTEDIKQDGIITLHAHEDFVTTYGFGANYSPTPNLEFAAQWSAPIDIHAQGTAYSQNGTGVEIGGNSVTVTPVDPADAKCATGGTPTALKACVDVEAVPMTATVAARWKFLDPKTKKLRGDVEVDLGYEHWGAKCDYNTNPNCLDPSDYHVTVDAQVTSPVAPGLGERLQPQLIEHDLRDTYSVRVGGSWIFPINDVNAVVARAGISYDTAAANDGWQRVDLDGMARTMFAIGGSYKFRRFAIDAGFSYIYEGSLTQNRNCQPTSTMQGCGADGSTDGYGSKGRQGPDPVDPILQPDVQFEYPVNEGTFSAHYIQFMLGASTWF